MSNPVYEFQLAVASYRELCKLASQALQEGDKDRAMSLVSEALVSAQELDAEYEGSLDLALSGIAVPGGGFYDATYQQYPIIEEYYGRV